MENNDLTTTQKLRRAAEILTDAGTPGVSTRLSRLETLFILEAVNEAERKLSKEISA